MPYASFDLQKEIAAAGHSLSGKNPHEALDILLSILVSRVPPADALTVGLQCKGEVDTKVRLEDVLVTARRCFKDMRSAQVQIRVEKPKRSDNHCNVVFACKVQDQQVGSYILKPCDDDSALFNLAAAVRVALAWRCVPLLSEQSGLSVRTAVLAMQLADSVKQWLQQDLFLLAFESEQGGK